MQINWCVKYFYADYRNFLIESFIRHSRWKYDDELLLWSGDWRMVISHISSQSHMKILIIATIQPATSRIWTWVEPEFRLCQVKLCSSDNHYTTVQILQFNQIFTIIEFWPTLTITMLSMIKLWNVDMFHTFSFKLLSRPVLLLHKPILLWEYNNT